MQPVLHSMLGEQVDRAVWLTLGEGNIHVPDWVVVKGQICHT